MVLQQILQTNIMKSLITFVFIAIAFVSWASYLDGTFSDVNVTINNASQATMTVAPVGTIHFIKKGAQLTEIQFNGQRYNLASYQGLHKNKALDIEHKRGHDPAWDFVSVVDPSAHINIIHSLKLGVDKVILTGQHFPIGNVAYNSSILYKFI